MEGLGTETLNSRRCAPGLPCPTSFGKWSCSSGFLKMVFRVQALAASASEFVLVTLLVYGFKGRSGHEASETRLASDVPPPKLEVHCIRLNG